MQRTALSAAAEPERYADAAEMIRYEDSVDVIRPDQLRGFFSGWPEHPAPETHLELLRGSDLVVLAIDTEFSAVVGFVTAITDGVLAAYLPFLEVLPAYRRRGIGSELVTRVVARLRDLYMVDLVCDPDVLPFYESLGFRAGTSAMIRSQSRRAGAASRSVTA
jgi:ribosomal protein S18 acetylase RimI-like enzyme